MARFLSLALLLLPVQVLAGAANSREEADEDYGVVADFSLTDRSGKTVERSDLLGKVWIASFVLINCPEGKCPRVTQTVQRLQEEMKDRRDLVFVTFTVDPKRDDPKSLSTYADAHDADPERWLFLTGKEETIDALLRSFHVPAGKPRKGVMDHSQRLVLVDRHGHIRGYFDGLEDTTNMPEGYFDANLRRLKRKVDEVSGPELPAWFPKDIPAFNATLNALSGALILLGYFAVRNRMIRWHIACMLSAIVVSALFLASYLFYHLVVKGGQPTRFSEQAPGAPTWVLYLYLAILGSHTLLAVAAAPLALFTAYQGLRGQIQRHVSIAKWTLPIWLYVSVTGVVVYWMLYRLYPAP